VSQLKERIKAILTLDAAAPAIEFDGKWSTWGEIERTYRAVDTILDANGLGNDSRIGLMLRNHAAVVPAVLAVIGDRCVVTARDAATVADIVAPHGESALAFSLDVTNAAQRKHALAQAIERFGGIDVLVNNAGAGNYKNLVDTSADEYDELMDTNVRSTFLFTRHVVPVMLARKSGTILMISSMAGVYGFGGESVYCMTKFAQIGFAQALDRELRGSGIKVGAICPGGVKTEFALGKGRTESSVAASDMLEPEDVASVVLMACTQSPGSRIIEVQMRTMGESIA